MENNSVMNITISLDYTDNIIKIDSVFVNNKIQDFIDSYPKILGYEKALNDFTDSVYHLLSELFDTKCIFQYSDFVSNNKELFIEYIKYESDFVPDLVDKLNALKLSFFDNNLIFVKA